MPPPPDLTPGVLLAADRLQVLADFGREFWPILVPTVLGLAAIYLLLPRARAYPPVWGAVIGGIALVFAGWSLIRVERDLGHAILFYAFSAVAVVGGVLLVVLRNPVRAALSFALVVLATCGLFLLQAAPFLMAATIIIYAGAIIVTFLFVLMLAQQAGLSDADQRSREPFLAALAGFVLMGAVLCVLHRNYDTDALLALQDNLGPYLEKTDRASRARSAEELDRTLGNKETFFRGFLDRVNEAENESETVRGAINRVQLRDQLLDTQQQVLSPNVPWQAKRDQLRKLTAVWYTTGSLQPPGNLPLSNFSGQRPNLPEQYIQRDRQGGPAMPAENVAALGESLFTDYLLPVELAGTLLLVATIGAIAIAGRRAEGLR